MKLGPLIMGPLMVSGVAILRNTQNCIPNTNNEGNKIMHGNPRDGVVNQGLPCFFDRKMNHITLTKEEAWRNVSKYLKIVDQFEEQQSKTNLHKETTSAIVNHVLDELNPFGDRIPCMQFKLIVDTAKENFVSDLAYQQHDVKQEAYDSVYSSKLMYAGLLTTVLTAAIYRVRRNGNNAEKNNKLKILERMMEIADPWMRGDIRKIPRHQLLFKEKDWQRMCFELMDDIRQNGTLKREEKKTLVNLINSLCESWDSNQHLQVRSNENAFGKRDMNENEVRLLLDRLAARHKQI